MSLDTYSNLQTALLDHIGSRIDVSAATVRDFITLAEAQLSRRLRLRRMVGRDTATVTNEYEAIPDDFAGPISFRWTDTSPITALEWVSPEAMADLKSGWDQTSDTPTKYTVVGAEFEFCPVPAASHSAALTYYKTVPALTDSAPTNWLLTTYPDLYLYGALVQAAPYLIDDPRLSVWTAMFSIGVEDANRISHAQSTGGRLHVGSPFAP